MSTDVRDLLRQLEIVDRHAAVWCACQCARTLLRWVPAGEERPRRAIETTEAWVRGEATEEACEASCRAALSAAPFAVGRGAARIFRDPHLVPSSAAEAARDAVRNTFRKAIPRVSHIDCIAEQREASDDQLDALLALVRAQRWPLTAPSFEQLCAAPGAVQVAWDAVADRAGTEQTIAELLLAHARAGRLGLSWADPVQRAVAERATDEDPVRALLSRTA